MKLSALISIFLFLSTSWAYAISGDQFEITGRLKSLDKDNVVLETKESTVSVPRKLLTQKYAVGEMITVTLKKTDLDSVKTTPIKK